MAKAYILVGCGGSGLRTLTRLAQLLAEDNYWKERVDEEVDLIGIDTNEVDLSSFREDVNSYFPHAQSRPHLHTLQLSRGVRFLDEPVFKYFANPYDEGTEPEGIERLYEHWWRTERDGHTWPYHAPKLNESVAAGAGGIPAVSFFLAWMSMQQFDRMFTELLSDIHNRLGPTGETDHKIHTGIVAGMAGGTGRGCWHLLAFKMAKIARDAGLRLPPPELYTFDAGVYYGRAHKEEEKIRMEVNALTGFSELSGWLKNAHGMPSRAFNSYRIPDLMAPHTPRSDVVTVDLADDPFSASPLRTAHVIFCDVIRPTLEDNIQYHEMAATAIYAKITHGSIKAADINASDPWFSYGAAAFEVASASLQRYCEGRSWLNAANILESRMQSERVEEALQYFLDVTGFDLQCTEETPDELKADDTGDFLQRVCDRLEKAYQPYLSGIEAALETDDPTRVEEAVDKLRTVGSRLVEDCVQRQWDAIGADPGAVVSNLLVTLLRETKAVRNVAELLSAVDSRLGAELGELPDPGDIKLSEDETPFGLATKHRGRKPLRAFAGESPLRRLDDREREDIRQKSRRSILKINYEALHTAINERFNRLRQVLSPLRKRVDQVVLQACKQARRTLEKQQKQHAGVSHYDSRECHWSFFADPQNLSSSIPAKTDWSRFYKRQLKPVMTEEQLDLLLEDASGGAKLPEDVADILIRALMAPIDDANIVRETQQLAVVLRKALVRANPLPTDFIGAQFNLYNVVSGLMKPWEDFLGQFVGDATEMNERLEQFEGFFGIRPQVSEHGVRIISEEVENDPIQELIASMCGSLVNTCRPHWRLRNNPGRHSRHKVQVFPPHNLDNIEKRIKKYSNNDSVEVQVSDFESGGSFGNPFVLLAYTSERTNSIEDIASLDYWGKMERTLFWLKACESPEGNGIFLEVDGNSGRGYPDPWVVQQDIMAQQRWRPWVPDAAKQASKQEDDTVEALLYSLMVLPDGFGDGQWEMPLMKLGANQKFSFARKAYENYSQAQGGKIRDLCDWEPGKQLAVRVDRAFKQLADGKSDTWRQYILDEAEVFWDQVARLHGVVPGSNDYVQLWDAQVARLAKLRDSAKTDEETAVWQRLAEAAQQKLS